MACYHDGMNRRTTTVRIPEDLAEKADIVARGRGISVNTLMLDALRAEIDLVKDDAEFMQTLRTLTDRDREILDRLAE
jgi:predicted transcriptional regulator